MSRYYHGHIRRLQQEAQQRFDRLMSTLYPHVATIVGDKEIVNVDGCEIRLAVDDFKNVLAEIRKLK